jgi:hypothetical protein
MIKLNLANFSHYSSNGIHRHLLSLQTNDFEIEIPRKAILNHCENHEIVMEYLSAAYAGHRLSLISKSFSYYVPCPDQNAPFFFQVTVSDIKKFAYLLFVIAQAFAEMGSKDALPGFHNEAANFLNNANQKKKANCRRQIF